MLQLILCILFNVGIFITFRAFRSYGVRTFPAIVVNYFASVVVGVIFLKGEIYFGEAGTPTWLWFGLGLGCFFIGVFMLMAYTSQHLGIGPAVTGAKLSMIVPMVAAILYVPGAVDDFAWPQWVALPLSLPALALTSYKPKRAAAEGSQLLNLLPLVIFILAGFLDTMLNYVNFRYLDSHSEGTFTATIFGAAAVIGLVVMVIKRQTLRWKDVVAGLLLGVLNYFSVYFLLAALRAFHNNGALVFPLNNIGIIMLSTLLAFLVFKERVSAINLTGLALATITILLFLI